MKSEVNTFRVFFKALCLFVIVNTIYAWIDPQGSLIFSYNVLFPGRTRLPFGSAGDPYTITVEDVDVLFASHAISARKDPKEYRVALIGDSSVWGEELRAEEMISAQWNAQSLPCDGRTLRTYNLGYPHPSVLKDLVILDKVVEYDPDLIIWFVTLNTLISQRVNPFLSANREQALKVIETYDIPFASIEDLRTSEYNFYERTLMGQRSQLARQIELQVLGIVWAATGEDNHFPAPRVDVLNSEVSDEPGYRGMQPSDDVRSRLLVDALRAGHEIAGTASVLIVNEPIFITSAEHSTVRYNPAYPRWVYDQYRDYLANQAQAAGWAYLDLWNAVPPEYFFDTGAHLSATGEHLLIQKINPTLQSIACNPKSQYQRKAP